MALELADLVKKFEAAVEATSSSRGYSERDRDYYDGYQWTAAEVATLQKRGQPAIAINRIKPKVDFLLGLERKQRNDPKAFPRTPSDVDGANAATDGIRYVLEDNAFDVVRSDVFKNALIEGFGGCDISVEPTKEPGQYKITLRWVPWDRLFFDPHSRREDFSDAMYRGQVVWMDEAAARLKWPAAANIFDETTASEGNMGETYDDRPQERWTDPQRKRVRVVEMWCRHGNEIVQYKFTKAGMLEDPKTSPYLDEEGYPEDALELMSAFVDRDGNRYGIVRNLVDIQDEINKRRSKALHLINVRQVKAERGAIDVEKTRRELAKPDGVVEYTPGMEFDVLDTGDMAAAQFNLLQEAKNEIDAVGVNAALSGDETRNMSGRALIARQEGGMAELGPIFDQLRMWQLRVYRKVWNRIRQYWTSEKWVRITDDEKVPRYVGLNAPVTRLDAMVEQMQAQGQQVAPEQIEAMRVDPMMQQVIGIKNNVAELDVDIILSEVPDTVAIQAEQFELLAKMAQSGVPIPPDALIEASGLRNKDAILKKMGAGEENGIPPQVAMKIQAAEQQIQAAGQEIAQREEQAKAAEQQMKDAKHALDMQEADVRHREEVLRLKEELATLKMERTARALVQPQPTAMQ